MRRRTASEPVQPWRRRINAPEAEKLRDRLIDWSNVVREIAADTWPDMPAGVEDRAADVWEPLLAVADLAGKHWPDTARVAAVTLVTEAKAARPSLGVQLLRDLRTVFDKLEIRNSVTDQLITNLKEIEDSPWAVIRKGEPLDARGLAQRLRKYGIEPKPIRDGDRVFKGYARAQFEDAWSRYVDPLGPADIEAVTAVTPDRQHCDECGRDLEHTESKAQGRCAECRLIGSTTDA